MKAYVTLLSSETYLKGVLALDRALKAENAMFPLYCVLSESINSDIQKELEKAGIPCLRLTRSSVDAVNQDGDFFSHWSYTFDKLQIWGLTQFEKIVFLDSDMLILRNIDHLFECLPFSAVPAGYSSCLREDWLYLNSGLMVIEPDLKVEKELLDLAPGVIKEFRDNGQTVGDQDVIKRYCVGWNKKPELHLDEGYNLFADYLTYYIRKWGYAWDSKSGKPISVVHFIGKRKPWMKKSLRNWLWIIKTTILNPYYLKAYLKYMSYLR